MAARMSDNGGPQILPPTSSPSKVELSLSNGTLSAASNMERTPQKPIGHLEAAKAILSRTSFARSEGLLRPIADTPPTAPSSPRLGPYYPISQ